MAAGFLSLLIVTSLWISTLTSFLQKCEISPKMITGLVHRALQTWPKNITAEDVRKARPKESFMRIQYLNGEFYGELGSKPQHSRDAAMRLFFISLQLLLVEEYELPNGIEFYLDTSDCNHNKAGGARFAFCAKYGEKSIAVPDYGFIYWPESGQTAAYAEVMRALLNASASAMGIKKDSEHLFFVGNLFPRRRALLEGFVDINKHSVQTHQFSSQTPKRSVPTKGSHFHSIESMCDYQYLLHLPGGISYSSRLRYLLLCNSTVLWLDDFVDPEMATPLYVEWFYPLLQPWKHYVPIANGKTLNQFMQNVSLALATGTKSEHPLLVQNLRIASQARDLARKLLHPSCVTKYWITMLQEYGRRLTYRITTPAAGTKKLIDEVQMIMRNHDNKVAGYKKQ